MVARHRAAIRDHARLVRRGIDDDAIEIGLAEWIGVQHVSRPVARQAQQRDAFGAVAGVGVRAQQQAAVVACGQWRAHAHVRAAQRFHGAAIGLDAPHHQRQAFDVLHMGQPSARIQCEAEDALRSAVQHFAVTACVDADQMPARLRRDTARPGGFEHDRGGGPCVVNAQQFAPHLRAERRHAAGAALFRATHGHRQRIQLPG